MSVTIQRVGGKWTEARFRYLADVRKGSLPSSNYGLVLKTRGVPYLTMEYLRGEISEPVFVSLDSGPLLASDNDILLLWDGSNAGEFLRAKRGVVSSTTALVTPKSIDPTFFFWACKGKEERVRAETVGMGIPHVNGEFLANLRIQFPHLNQQRAIADYLDRETARLDALVAAKERLLDLLAEKRRGLITQAVTRGLNPHAPLRDSGIPWLGEIPAHWELKRLKHVGRAIIGLTFDPADTLTDGRGVLVLRASNVRNQKIVLEDNLFVLMDIPDILRTRVDDILICSRSGSRALIGKSALIDQAAAGLTFGAFMTVFRSPHNEYLFYIFNSPLFDYQAGAFSTSTINQLTIETLNGMEIPLPPLSEQKAIVARLREGMFCLDRLVEATDRTIVLLKERHAALIAAAVTGQIDVKEEA